MVVKKRKNIRLPRRNYEYPNQAFSITICTANRRKIFTNPHISKKVIDTVYSGPIAKQTDMFAYCLMPDHFHVLIAAKDGNLIDVISGWKRFTGNIIRKNGSKGPF